MKEDNRQLVAKKRIAEKRVSLAIEELSLKREEEKRYKLTPEEIRKHDCLAKVFSDNHPAERIKHAIDDHNKIKNLRKDYLQAFKNKHEKEKKDNSWMSGLNGILIAGGLPISVIGLVLMEPFQIPGIAVCITGICMAVPAAIFDIIRRKRAGTELKAANEELEELSYKIFKITANVDAVCNEFHVPINDPDRNKYLIPLYQNAQDYEALLQKKIDYELFVRINGSDHLKNSIIEDLKLLTGQVITDEQTYPGIMEIMDQNKNFLEDNGSKE